MSMSLMRSAFRHIASTQGTAGKAVDSAFSGICVPTP